MGLDMYLFKTKKLGGTAKEVNAICDYLDWENRGNKYINCSLKEWCGLEEKEINKELVEKYRPEFIIRYDTWDTEKKYGITTIFDEVAYWRKANEIHKWFVDNVQNGNDDCELYEVTEDDLKKLRKLCKKIIKEPKLAEELLPTQEGFFFGGTGYDEYYFEDLKHTKKILKKIIKETDFETETVYYRSSW